MTATPRGELVQALGPLPAAIPGHSSYTNSTSAQQPNNIDDRDAIESKQSRCFVSSFEDERGINLPKSSNTEEIDEKMKEISEELAAATSKVPSRDDKATKFARSRNPILLAQAYLKQATNDVRRRGGVHNEAQPTDMRSMGADRPSLLSRFSDTFDAGIINDISDSSAYVTPSNSVSPGPGQRINNISPSTSLQVNGNVGKVDEKAQELSLLSATTARMSSDRHKTLEENLRADLLRRLKSEKVPQTIVQTSRAPIARDRFPPAPDAADGSEDDAGDLGILESKLRSKARLRFKLASEKRLTENVNRIDQSNSREPVRGIGGDEFVGKEVEEDRTTELRNILRQRRSTNETK